MYLKLLIYFLFFHFTLLYSKKHEIGTFIGKLNLISNIGKNTHTEIIPINWNNSSSKSIGISYSYNVNLQQSIKLHALFNNIIFDNFNSMNYNIYKSKKVNNNFIINTGLSYNYYFWKANNQKTIQIIPYVFGGIEITRYRTIKNHYNYKLIDKTNKNINNTISNKNIKYNIVNINNINEFNETNHKTTLSLKSGFGIQINFTKNWIFCTEIALHPTFINDLDYNFNKNNKINYNLNNNKLLSQSYLNLFIKKFQNNLQKKPVYSNFINDWYIVTGIGITYTFD